MNQPIAVRDLFWYEFLKNKFETAHLCPKRSPSSQSDLLDDCWKAVRISWKPTCDGQPRRFSTWIGYQPDDAALGFWSAVVVAGAAQIRFAEKAR